MPRNKTFYIVGKLYNGEFEKKYIDPIKRRIYESGLELDEDDPTVVISVGGDGTLLRAARKYPESELLGIRAESKGSYSNMDFDDYEKVIDKLISEDYTLLKLPKVELTYKDKRLEGINEVYFFRDVAKFPGADRFRVYRNGEDLYSDVIYADGCLLATPSGSTAYSWSYDGPIIEEGLVLTPMAGCLLHRTKRVGNRIVAEHALPKIIDDNDEILVEMERDAPNILCADNEMIKDIYFEKGDKIKFKKSNSYVKLVKL